MMILAMSMSVHEMQRGSLVHFCMAWHGMVNLGFMKSRHRSDLVLRLAHGGVREK